MAKLDLETIWEQTANSLGQVLNASRCIICSYKQTIEDLQQNPSRGYWDWGFSRQTRQII